MIAEAETTKGAGIDFKDFFRVMKKKSNDPFGMGLFNDDFFTGFGSGFGGGFGHF